MTLFLDTFRRNVAYKQEMKNIKHSLYNKSWLIHIVMTFSRIAYPILGIAHW